MKMYEYGSHLPTRNPHYILLSSSQNFSQDIAVFHILLQHQIYIEPLVAPFPKPGPIGGSLLVLVKGGALGCGAPWLQVRQPHQVSELPLGSPGDIPR